MIEIGVQDKVFAFDLRDIYRGCEAAASCLFEETLEEEEECQVLCPLFKFRKDLQKNAPLFFELYCKFAERISLKLEKRRDSLVGEWYGFIESSLYGLSTLYSANGKTTPPNLDGILQAKSLIEIIVNEKSDRKEFYRGILPDQRFKENNFTWRVDLESFMDNFELEEGTREMVRFLVKIFLMAVEKAQEVVEPIKNEKNGEELISKILKYLEKERNKNKPR